jgi:hypothetical protein
MTIEFKIHGCNIDDLARQVEDLHYRFVGPVEVDDQLSDMPLNDLIALTKARCAEQGWHVEITMPDIVMDDEEKVVIPDKIARRESESVLEVVETAESIKEATITELKALYFEDGGTEIVESLRRKFGGKPFSEHAPEKFIGIRKALREARPE